MAIRDVLFPALREAFPNSGLRVSGPPDVAATFPALCAEVGDVIVYDDEDEATVIIQNMTHFHINPYDSAMSEEERARWITDEVVDFLGELFADRILLWSVDQGRGSGGCQPYEGSVPADIPKDADKFLWSGRI